MKRALRACLYVVIGASAAIIGYLLSDHFGPVTGAGPADQGNAGSMAAMIGTPRPEFSLPDLDGRRHGPGEWSGKILALNFWATWCPPCLHEIPAFIRLQEKYAGRDVQFVGIAMQTADEVRDFVAATGINYPILTGEIEVIRVAEDYGNRYGTLPYTVIIDRNQQVSFIKRGPLSETEAEQVILSLIK
ncbi:MAG: TlpA family protein disulfide reductase [Gammaproteobacteria bacterium]